MRTFEIINDHYNNKDLKYGIYKEIHSSKKEAILKKNTTLPPQK